MAAPVATRAWLFLVSTTASSIGCANRLDGLEGRELEATDSTQLLEPTAASSVESQLISSSESSVDLSSAVSVAPTTAVPTCAGGELNSDGFCVPEVRCAPGTFVSRVDDAEVCFPCESGQFSSEFDAEGCRGWRDCVAGHYVLQPGSATRDRQCATCPDGETTTSENAGECTGASDCAAGTYRSDGGCTTCSSGTYCSGKTDRELPCDASSWDNDDDPATPCEVKTSCAPGQFVNAEGDAVTDRTCGFCEAGTFSTQMNASECETWSTCVAGDYVGLQGTSTTDRECSPCASGSYTEQANESACRTWTNCAAPSRYAAAEPSAVQDRTCSACPEGAAASADNLPSCDLVVPANLVSNYDFESATTTGWESWIGTLSNSTARAHTGTRSLLVTGPSTGPAATNLDAVVQAGASYDVSFWVNVGRVASAQVNITRELNCAGNVTYLWLANNAAVPSGVWTQLTGNFTVPASCATPRLKVYAEGSGTNVDLYVDSVSVTKVP